MLGHSESSSCRHSVPLKILHQNSHDISALQIAKDNSRNMMVGMQVASPRSSCRVAVRAASHSHASTSAPCPSTATQSQFTKLPHHRQRRRPWCRAAGKDANVDDISACLSTLLLFSSVPFPPPPHPPPDLFSPPRQISVSFTSTNLN